MELVQQELKISDTVLHRLGGMLSLNLLLKTRFHTITNYITTMQYVMMMITLSLTLKCYDSETGKTKKYALKLTFMTFSTLVKSVKSVSKQHSRCMILIINFEKYNQKW